MLKRQRPLVGTMPLVSKEQRRTWYDVAIQPQTPHWEGSGCLDGSTKHQAITREIVVCFPFPTDRQCCFLGHDLDHSPSLTKPFVPKPKQTLTIAASGEETLLPQQSFAKLLEGTVCHLADWGGGLN